MQTELAPFGIDLFDLEEEARGQAKGFSGEGDGLADGGGTIWLKSFDPERAIKPLEIAFPVHQVLPDHLDWGRNDGGGADTKAHHVFLLLIAGWRQGMVRRRRTMGADSIAAWGRSRARTRAREWAVAFYNSLR